MAPGIDAASTQIRPLNCAWSAWSAHSVVPSSCPPAISSAIGLHGPEPCCKFRTLTENSSSSVARGDECVARDDCGHSRSADAVR